MKCQACGAEGTGNFCAGCGAPLGARPCPSCGKASPGGSRFCIHCGTGLAAGAARPAAGMRRESMLGWWVAGLAIVGLVIFAAAPIVERSISPRPAPTAAPAAAPAGGTSTVDLSSMTPREAADRLFDRIMRAVSRGDSAEVTSFLPMALGAYERAEPLDLDGRFHVALLESAGGNDTAAREAAEAGLADDPDHLLLLSAAGAASARLGDREAAERYYRRLLEVWDQEQASGRPEYAAHSGLLPELQQEARSYLGSNDG